MCGDWSVGGAADGGDTADCFSVVIGVLVVQLMVEILLTVSVW